MADLKDFDPDCFEPNYEERTYPVRGKIIAHFAMFEKNIEAFLAAGFSTTIADRQKMQNIVFDRMTFESKRTSVWRFRQYCPPDFGIRCPAISLQNVH